MKRRSTYETDTEPDDPPERLSKSAKKRQMHALQALGVELMALPPKQLKKIPLTERLLIALEELRLIKDKNFEALRRQKQLIGKLMRFEDLEQIQAAFDGLEDERRASAMLANAASEWRDRLLANPADIAKMRGAAATDAALKAAIDHAIKQPDGAAVKLARRAVYDRIFELLSESL